MKISHKITNVSGKNIVYIYIKVEDIYEFGKENLGKGENTDFLTKLREYITNNLDGMKKAAAVIVINGVVVGSLTLAAIYPNKKTENLQNNNLNHVQVYEESSNTLDKEQEKEKNKHEEIAKEEVTQKDEVKEEHKKEENKVTTSTQTTNKVTTNKITNTNKTNTSTKKPASNTTNTNKLNTTSKSSATTTATKPLTTPTTQTTKPSTTTATVKPSTVTDASSNINITTKPTTNTATTTKPSTTTNQTTTITSERTIKFNNGGVISNIDLEEYVIGVVAAEMPASFHSEALKAQAVVARTYAMKKASKGITLINSTSHQVYNSIEQMKTKWGSSYSTYYNKIKNAVNATKGKVLKYNGSYIEALYFSMSNGKTELPKYVWSTNYPYLQVVSSSWDENISAAKYTITMTYEKISSKLGVTVNENTEIKVLSKTAGDRVNEISIGGKTFTGVKVRSLLGLRSADFSITKKSNGVSITTRGFGHGVGMSQYGANGAAKAGYTYSQILSHYYSGASLVNI